MNASPSLRRAHASSVPAGVPHNVIASARASVRSPDSAASNSFCPLPDTPAMPTISPARTVERDRAKRRAERIVGAHVERIDDERRRAGVRCRDARGCGSSPPIIIRASDAVVSWRGSHCAGDAAGAQHRRALAQRADLVELVADVENAAAFGGERAQRVEEPQRPPAASAPTSARP